MQKFVSKHEPAFLLVEAGRRVHEDFFGLGVDSGDRNRESVAQRRVFNDAEVGRHRSHQRVAADEPVPSLYGRCQNVRASPQIVLIARRHIDGARYSQGQAFAEAVLPIHVVVIPVGRDGFPGIQDHILEAVSGCAQVMQ
ncbi:hypothetical protein D3C81_1708860 [compost metagenome]